MAKDPAFLFYSQDFYTGVSTMNFEDRGKYITLLCLMHQQGRMPEETISFLVGSVSVNLKAKFSIDENGLWYNSRLELEAEKRSAFTKSRRDNGKQGGRPKKEKPNGKPNGKPKGNHKGNLMGNENENVIDIIKVSEISFEEIKPFIDIKIMRKSLKPEHSLNVWSEFIQREQDTKFDDITHVRRMLEGYITKTDWSYLTVASTNQWLYGSGVAGYYKYQDVDGKQSNMIAVSRDEYLNSKK